jgi:hypothetical protein
MIDMKNAIKAAFEQAIATSDARSKAETEAQQQRLTKQQQFDHDFGVTCTTVIAPALKEVADVLRRNGWNADVLPMQSDGTIGLSVYKEDMFAIGGDGRPHIAFRGDTDNQRVMVSFVPAAPPIYAEAPHTLSDFTDDFVQGAALKFFRFLSQPAA